MPRNQFTQADFEESIRQRWQYDNPEVAGELIGWNRKKNEEIEKKQKQKQKRIEQQKLKAERKRSEVVERETQEQEIRQKQAVIPEQSPTKETGAIPKQRNSNNQRGNKQFSIRIQKEKEQKAKQEAEGLQKEKEKNYPNFKKKLAAYLEVFNMQIVFSLFYEIKKVYNKRNNIPKTHHIPNKDYKEFYKLLSDHIKSHYTSVLLKQLLEKDYVDFNVEKFTKNHTSVCRMQTNGTKLTTLLNNAKDIISNKFGATIDIFKLLHSMPDVKNAKGIENDLINKFPNLYKSLSGQSNQECSVVLHLGEVKDFRKLLEQIIDESGYKVKVDKAMEELTKRYLPSNSIKETSIEPQGACAQAEK